jgi:hypothetical protein
MSAGWDAAEKGYMGDCVEGFFWGMGLLGCVQCVFQGIFVCSQSGNTHSKI